MDQQEHWWESYGIDPDALTADVEAANVGTTVGHTIADSASAAMLSILAEHAVPIAKGMPHARQAAFLRACALIVRNVADSYVGCFDEIR